MAISSVRPAWRAGIVVAFLACVGALLPARRAHATDLVVEDVRLDADRLTVTARWANAWRDDVNHDGVWLFAKARGADGRWRHLRLAQTEARVVATEAGPPPSIDIAEDGVGAFAWPSSPHRGPCEFTAAFAIEPSSIPSAAAGGTVDVRAYGIEMVLVPEGPFHVGEVGPRGGEFAAFFRSDAEGKPAGTQEILSEASLRIAPEVGALWYPVGGDFASYGGDHGGPLPATFPKGFAAFWCMKYELTQGEYVAFLNTLNDEAAAFRAPHAHPEYTTFRGTIDLVDGAYVTRRPRRPMNFVSWDDGCGFADWAGLRPMTELEFTKACRGPSAPSATDFPWGTSDLSSLARVMGPDDELAATGPADEALGARQHRVALGTSYYGVFDLAGSVWEKCVTVGHRNGRAFAGTHGDGSTRYGGATNVDWPRGDVGSGGFGYRGGGFYSHGENAGEFNPWSPVEWRRFGSWGDGPRSKAYGFRAVRTAPTSASRLAMQTASATARLREGMRQLVVNHAVPGVSAAVVVDGVVVCREAVGHADLEHAVEATAATRFPIGSVSKAMTAAALLRHPEIDLDAPLESLLGDFPFRGRGMTCAHVLGHVSGLDDAWADALYTSTESFATTVDALGRAYALPLRSEPSTAFAYATGSYTVLAAVLESVTRSEFKTALRSSVLTPLQLVDTDFNRRDAILPRRSALYVRDSDGALRPAPAFDPSFKWAGAGVLSTAEDVALFGAALLDDSFLPAAARARMFTSGTLQDGSRTGYGLGVWVRERDGRTVIDCPGGGPGLAAHLRIHPDRGVVLAILANRREAPLAALIDAIEGDFLAVAER